MVRVPGLSEDDVVFVQSLLRSAGFALEIEPGFGEVPDRILIDERDLGRVKRFLADVRVRGPGGTRIPIPW